MATGRLHAASRLATENFVKGGLATKTGPDDVANAIAVAVDGKQDSLPSVDGNEGKVLGVTDVFGSLDWIEQPSLEGYATEEYVDDILGDISEVLSSIRGE